MKFKRSVPFFQKLKAAQVDAANGVLKGVVVLEEGWDKYKEYFDEVALQQLVTLGNAQPQGVKSRFGHPNMCESALGSYIGRYKNFRVDLLPEAAMGDPKGQLRGVYADLYLDPVSKKSPKGNLYDYVVEMANKNDDMFGNSIVYMPADVEVMEIEGEPIECQRFESFPASDLVDSPAATTSLFKDFGTEKDFAAIATQFLEDNPLMAEAIMKNENSLIQFISKYKKQMATEKAKKSFKEKWGLITKEISELFADEAPATEKKDITANTADGKPVTISDTDGDGVPMVGDTVTDETGAPMANAKIPMEDGTTINTDDKGVITSIDAAPEAAAAPVANPPAEKSFEEQSKEWKSKYDAEVAARKKDEEEHEKEMNEADKTITSLSDRLKKYKSEYVAPSSKNAISKKEDKEELSADDRKAANEARKKELADKKNKK